MLKIGALVPARIGSKRYAASTQNISLKIAKDASLEYFEGANINLSIIYLKENIKDRRKFLINF